MGVVRDGCGRGSSRKRCQCADQSGTDRPHAGAVARHAADRLAAGDQLVQRVECGAGSSVAAAFVRDRGGVESDVVHERRAGAEPAVSGTGDGR